MTDARDRAVIALASQEAPMNTVQGSDQQVRVERVRGIEPPLRAWEPLGRGAGPWQGVARYSR